MKIKEIKIGEKGVLLKVESDEMEKVEELCSSIDKLKKVKDISFRIED